MRPLTYTVVVADRPSPLPGAPRPAERVVLATGSRADALARALEEEYWRGRAARVEPGDDGYRRKE